MSHNKKEIEIPGESTEDAKNLELDEREKKNKMNETFTYLFQF
jgi:hypothetical protein